MDPSAAKTQQLLISFSGIDGAGKSTQIGLLQAALRRAGLRQELITFWDDVVALKSLREGAGHKIFKGDQGVGSPDRPITRRDKNVKSPLLTLMRMGFYFLDTLSLRRSIRQVRAERPGVGADVIVFDRFIYDELANLPQNNPLVRIYIALILRLAPKPDVALLLDADPDAAFARKPEYPLEFLHANRNAYLQLARTNGTTIIAPAAIETAHAAIMKQVWAKKDALRSVVGEAGHVSDQKQFAS